MSIKVDQNKSTADVDVLMGGGLDASMEKRTLARHLKHIRTVAHVSQYSLSVGAGIDRSRLSSIENGYISPRPDEVEQIERFVTAAQYQQVANLKRVLAKKRSGSASVTERKSGNGNKH